MKGHKKQRCEGIKLLYLDDRRKYIGSVYDGKPSGHGILETESSTYEGFFLNGKKHGHGVEVFDSGRHYAGEYAHDLWHGKGTLRMENGTVYEGPFHTGTYHGYGKITHTDSSYEGNWNHGTYHGHGTHKTMIGTFEGEFYYNVRHGRGTFTDHLHNIYSGIWRRGLREGKGIYTTEDGTYTGHWSHDLQSGHGIWVSKMHGIYDGHFKRGKRHKKGTQTWPDGTTYEGGWSKGKQTGHGVQTWTDGSSYCGFWLKDKYNGTGTLNISGSSSFKGEWDAGKREGYVVETKMDGSISRGPWTNDIRHGTFTEDEQRQLYIWGTNVQFESLKNAGNACKKMTKARDYDGARVVLQHYPKLVTWKFFFKSDQRGINLYLMDKKDAINALKKNAHKIFKAKRYTFLIHLVQACPEEALVSAQNDAEELFDALSKEFVPNPWILRGQSYSEDTKNKLLNGLFLGELGRCPPKDPFTRLPINENSGNYLNQQPGRATKIYSSFMKAIGAQPTIREMARSFDVQDFEELLTNARETNDRVTIKRVMKERNDYIRQQKPTI
jgi:hypothetical protein